MRMKSGVVSALLVFSFASTAWATYSITAVDQASRQVGGAGASCIAGSPVSGIYKSAPGFGVVNSQARNHRPGRDEAVRLLAQGSAPRSIIERLTDPSFDADFERRQYGIVDLRGRAAAHTGALNGSYAGDLQESFGTFFFSIQGNILTGRAVLTQARDAFVESEGCDLADHLMNALEGGAANGQGDRRCTPDIPSDAAYIQVDLPDAPAGSYLALEVHGTAPRNPLTLLRAAFQTWRESHPCPTTPAGEGGSAGAPSTTGTSPSEERPQDASPSRASRGACGCQWGGASTYAPWLSASAILLALSRRRARSPRRDG